MRLFVAHNGSTARVFMALLVSTVGMGACGGTVNGKASQEPRGAGGSDGGFDGGDGGSVACPRGPYSGDVTDPLPPSSFDGGTFGCHAERTLAPPGWETGSASLPACANTSTRCTYEPGTLPCGACSEEGLACAMSVYAPCDCGQGAFLDTYWDQWECRCTGGEWDCRVTGASGSSCFRCFSPP